MRTHRWVLLAVLLIASVNVTAQLDQQIVPANPTTIDSVILRFTSNVVYTPVVT